MEGEVPNVLHRKYALQPGIVDVDHLELVALTGAAGSLWVPHFRLITPSLQSGVYIPQKRYGRGPHGGFLHNPGLESFAREDGSYLPVIDALVGNYAGLVNRDLPGLAKASPIITLRFEVNIPYHPR